MKFLIAIIGLATVFALHAITKAEMPYDSSWAYDYSEHNGCVTIVGHPTKAHIKRIDEIRVREEEKVRAYKDEQVRLKSEQYELDKTLETKERIHRGYQDAIKQYNGNKLSLKFTDV